MNILFLVPDKTDPTCFYRASGIAHDLEGKTGGQIVTLSWNEAAITWQVISNFDIIMLQRPFTKVSADLMLFAKNMGKRVWIDYDDALLNLNPENKAFEVYDDKDTQDNIKKCLALADVVSVPTLYLAEEYKAYNKNIVVIPNAFNDGLFTRGELKAREKKAIWRGPESHIYDIMTHGRELNQATEEYLDWEFIFMGYRPWFLSITTNKSYIKGLDIIAYYYKLLELVPALVHVPLHDNIFNRCRSNVAYIEGNWSGAVCVVPSWWNLPGAIAYSSPESYYQAMMTVLAGEIDVIAQNRMAWEYIMDVLPLSKVNVQRLQIINELM